MSRKKSWEIVLSIIVVLNIGIVALLITGSTTDAEPEIEVVTLNTPVSYTHLTLPTKRIV